MITSLVFTGKHNVGVNSHGNIKVDDKKISLKEIPFIRYRFDSYGEDEFKFILDNMKKFEYQVHLAELTVDGNTVSTLEKMQEYEEFNNLAIFLYVNITDENVAHGLSEETQEILEEVSDFRIDRIMIKDNSKNLFPVAASKLKLEVADCTGENVADIGICSSPLSFRSGQTDVGQACLTAVWARRIMSDFAKDPDMIPVPSANHECMDCCGCIKYIIVDRSYAAPEGVKAKKESKSGNKAEAAPKKEKPKGFVIPTYF